MAHLSRRKITDPRAGIIDARGLGDTIEQVTEALGIKTVVKIATGALGIEDCGCDKRRDALNQMFPYNTKQDVNTETTTK